MVKLVKNRVNKIPVKVTAIIDYTGFSASLSVGGITKNIEDLKARSLAIEFSPEEIDAIGEGALGTLVVQNTEGKTHISSSVQFKVIDSDTEAAGFQVLRTVLVSMLPLYGSRRSGGGDIPPDIEELIKKEVHLEVDKAMEGIDEKIEADVNEIFESSDPDTIGGQFRMLETSVYDNLEPRVTTLEEEVEEDLKPRVANVETILAKKISMDYEDSDEEVIFNDGLFSGSEDSDE